MTTPHKWAHVIKAWADGKPIERRFLSDKWREVIGHGTPPFDDARNEWRIKPETVKYRRYLWETSKNVVVGVINCSGCVTVQELIDCASFIRWIDDDWQEIEV